MSGESEHHDQQALKALMLEMGEKARAASRIIATASKFESPNRKSCRPIVKT
jgi:hypothetical protein